MPFNAPEKHAKISQDRRMLQKKAVIWDPDRFRAPKRKSTNREDTLPASKTEK